MIHVVKKDWVALNGADIVRSDADVAQAIYSLGVWFPRSLYRVMPILLPFVVRDNQCRPKGKAKVDEWAWPSEDGNLRDDNSLIKTLVNYFNPVIPVRQDALPVLAGGGLKQGWTCCHVSPAVAPSGNSFVANVVWLPTLVRGVTDLPVGGERTLANTILRETSRRTFWAVDPHPLVKEFVNEAWELVDPDRSAVEGDGPVAKSFFRVDENWVRTRLAEIRTMSELLLRRGDGETAPEGPKNLRKTFKIYSANLHRVSPDRARDRGMELRRYHDACKEAVKDDPPWRE